MSLYIYVADEDMRNLYKEHLANKHRYTDSGFDLLMPKQYLECDKNWYGVGLTVHTGIIVAALTENGNPSPSLLLPRSSICNTPLRLCNSIGLIDMGYRGEVMAKCDFVPFEIRGYVIEKGDRIFQLVQHNFMPWKYITIVDNPNDLPYAIDNRGTGGFGSTGK